MSAGALPLLAVEDLSVAFAAGGGESTAVDGVGFSIGEGEVMALVGESGCGKSVTSLAIMGLLPRPAARIARGRILFRDRDGERHDLAALPERRMRAMRGNAMAMIFQEPMTSLNPLEPIGDQVAEPLVTHRAISRRGRQASAIAIIARWRMPPESSCG